MFSALHILSFHIILPITLAFGICCLAVSRLPEPTFERIISFLSRSPK